MKGVRWQWGLVGATGVFLTCRWAQAVALTTRGWVIWALRREAAWSAADWFAVTALFQHRPGIPIPHTAIIKRRKDRARPGTRFVRENFPVAAGRGGPKLRDAQIPEESAAKWLSEATHAQRVAAARPQQCCGC